MNPTNELMMRLMAEHMEPPSRPPAMVRWLEQQGKGRATPPARTPQSTSRRSKPYTPQEVRSIIAHVRATGPSPRRGRPSVSSRAVVPVAPRPEREEPTVFGVPYNARASRRDPTEVLATLERLRADGRNLKGPLGYPSTFPAKPADLAAEREARRRLAASKAKRMPATPLTAPTSFPKRVP